jgi:hypothetical protein
MPKTSQQQLSSYRIENNDEDWQSFQILGEDDDQKYPSITDHSSKKPIKSLIPCSAIAIVLSCTALILATLAHQTL